MFQVLCGVVRNESLGEIETSVSQSRKSAIRISVVRNESLGEIETSVVLGQGLSRLCVW